MDNLEHILAIRKVNATLRGIEFRRPAKTSLPILERYRLHYRKEVPLW